jgi:hypothetical protein
VNQLKLWWDDCIGDRYKKKALWDGGIRTGVARDKSGHVWELGTCILINTIADRVTSDSCIDIEEGDRV